MDIGATLGSIGGAVAFILTQEALLVGLPVVLPLLALYASRRHEQLRLEVLLATPFLCCLLTASCLDPFVGAGWPAGLVRQPVM